MLPLSQKATIMTVMLALLESNNNDCNVSIDKVSNNNDSNVSIVTESNNNDSDVSIVRE